MESVYHFVTIRVNETSWAHIWRLSSRYLGTGYDKVVVESPCNIADDPLHSLLVLHRRPLYEPTNVADGECQVWLYVGEVAKAPHKTPAHSVHLLCRAVAA
jgi:hypothetical protein